jgi:predicted transcriptional regulator
MKRSTPIISFRLRERRLRRVLGDLEADVMEVLWRRGEASIREVWEELKRRRSITFNSIMTIMNRLVAKGLLRREDGRGRYRYTPRMDRETLLARVSHDVAEALVEEFGEIAVAQFVAVLQDADPEKLAALERMIRERRGGRR